MVPRIEMSILAALALLATLAAAPAAGASETKASWTVTRAGKVEATESVKRVVSETNAAYASGRVTPPGKKARPLLTHQKRDADGALEKYRRQRKVRQGEGLFAFRKGDGVRIVPLNDDFEPVVLAGAHTRLVWDPAALHSLHDWPSRLGAGAELPFLDVGARRVGTAKASPGDPRAVADKAGARREVASWRVDGLVDGGLALLVDGGQLVGVVAGERRMLRKGWSWDAPAAAPPEPADGASGEEPPAEKPAADKPPAEKPAADKPPVEEPAADKPPAEKPAADKPPAEKPPAKKPPAAEPPADPGEGP